MFEIGIFCVIFLAISYWAVLWLMGRREDVLHGEFVDGEAQSGEPAQAVIPEPPERPAFAERPVFPERPSLPQRPVLAERVALPARPVQAAAQPAFRPERLEQLLASIKQDLNQLVQK
ncbi:hypothetical protein FFI89_021275 [Bradyrhizobium sp. KBS0727]|jgi:hypothetical protein|uniref:hypothetical protein n=1 Tax=unclassified Bradyrhizobium TaxID=2631580 RepID=UPI00110EBF74|nr:MULTISPECIES: hypothetical protein [unclassified Bradyrhizobium]QDW39446.1 hypothetical protein FFI71_021280 [Bradyrhizobium sp. KBS0725]QDW46049.1 hypothetical protein FFI89_021275 [Bradyrhizobium sp. KBS0727]